MERVNTVLLAPMLVGEGEVAIDVARKGEFIPIRQIEGERGGMRAYDMPEPAPSGRRKIVCWHIVGLFWRRIESGVGGGADRTLGDLDEGVLLEAVLVEGSDEAILAEGLEEMDLVAWRVVL